MSKLIACIVLALALIAGTGTVLSISQRAMADPGGCSGSNC